MRVWKMVLPLVALTWAMPSFAADPKLDGKWVIESLVRDGKADDTMKGAIRENTGEKYSLTPSAGKSVAGTMKVDAAKKTMDMMPEEGRYKGKTLQGIYEVDGDTLKVCFAEPGKERPAKLTSDNGNVLVVHKKAK